MTIERACKCGHTKLRHWYRGEGVGFDGWAECAEDGCFCLRYRPDMLTLVDGEPERAEILDAIADCLALEGCNDQHEMYGAESVDDCCIRVTRPAVVGDRWYRYTLRLVAVEEVGGDLSDPT